MPMVEEGAPAPDFTLPSSTGGEIALSELRGQSVVLYFYPRDNTPGCTREACAFRDAMRRIRRRGAVVLGVSPDSLSAHEKFKTQHKLNFPLLSDTERKVAKRYGAFGEKVSYGRKTMGMIRSTFVIDRDGVVRKVFPKVKVEGHDEQVLDALEAIES